MGKVMLVLDEMPESCFGCVCEYDTQICTGAKKLLGYENLDNRPDWCPLRPLPKRKDNAPQTNWQIGFENGWNACLDVITGEEEV